MSKLWKKNGISSHPAVHKYIINTVQDKTLLPYDIQASIAHAKMLAKVKLISVKEKDSLVKGLQEIENLHKKEKFHFSPEDEDCHSAIENYLVKTLGDIGKKIHMGRSRNDQVLVAMRLLSKEKLKRLIQLTKSAAKTLISFAQKHEFIPMPGYTHTQQAMPSSVGQLVGSYIEALLDDIQLLKNAYDINDQNPLGSAAGFGTSLPLDREYTTKLLGFKKTQINSIYCQNSRGKIESFILSCETQLMLTLGKIANDLIWFTSKEFDFFTVSTSLTTGSSIMPQKKNLDIMEVLRANVSIIISLQTQIQTVYQNLISGYHKDLKITKKALLEGFDICESSIAIVETVFKNISPNKKRLNSSFDNEIFATDKVNEMVLKGMPFRDAYRKVGENLKDIDSININNNIREKTHLGATGNLKLDQYTSILKAI